MNAHIPNSSAMAATNQRKFDPARPDRPRHASGAASASHVRGMLASTPKGRFVICTIARWQWWHGGFVHEGETALQRAGSRK